MNPIEFEVNDIDLMMFPELQATACESGNIANSLFDEIKFEYCDVSDCILCMSVDHYFALDDSPLRDDVPDSVPAPILVGIETNPGPPSKKKVKNESKKVKINRPSVGVAKSMVTTSRTSPKPRFTNLPNGDLIVTFKEYLFDLNGSSTLISNYMNINAGNPAMFPWLSGIATRFEMYRFEKLGFSYEPACATDTKGTVLFSIDYDPTDSQFISKRQYLNTRTHCRAAPWESTYVECAQEDLRRRSTYFVDVTGNGSNDESLMVGSFNYATVAMGAITEPVGELYVNYTVRLMSPQLDITGGFAEQISSSAGLNSSKFVGSSPAITGSTLFVRATDSALVCQVAGDYLCTIEWTGTVLSADTAQAGTASMVRSNAIVNSAGTLAMNIFLVSAGLGSTITLSATATTVTFIRYRFAPYNNSYALVRPLKDKSPTPVVSIKSDDRKEDDYQLL